MKRAELLNSVTKPTRYTGGEWNSVKKDLSKISCKFALTLPDVYEIGMSNLGISILYSILNAREDIACERVYAPWDDMEAKMREQNMQLFSLESKLPLKDFDLWGFSLQYEMIFTNVLNMLNLADISIFSMDRDENDPFIVGGGPVVYNVEPVADFFDFFVVGEGEEIIIEIADAFNDWKKSGKIGGRKGFLEKLLDIQGIYVPSFYEPKYDDNGNFLELTPKISKAPAKVYKRIVKNMDDAYNMRPIVPYMDIVHNRIMLELFRGCTRGCRFCQAGMCYRPVRERSPEKLLELARNLVDATGYDEISLTSLSSADYSYLAELVDDLSLIFCAETVSLSLPSLRIDSFSIDLADKISKTRKTSLTFAPEAGTQRLRDVINKGVTEEDLMTAVSAAFKKGWRQVKLYFMMGLPTETDEDIIGIADLAKKVVKLYEEIAKNRKVKVTVSVSCFVPKPYTPFEWYEQIPMREFMRRQELLKSHITDKNITFNYHDAKVSVLEAALARGDRKVAKAIEFAFKSGAKFDGWSDHFKFDVWEKAFEDANLSMTKYARGLSIDAPRPWEITNPAVSKKFLINEWEKAKKAELTRDCRKNECVGCGVCNTLNTNVTVVKDYKSKFDNIAETEKVETESFYHYRARITKGKEVEFLSHLDYMSAIEKAVIRAKLPIAYSTGYHPRMKLSLASALSVGVTSVAEYMDLTLTKNIPQEIVFSKLSIELPKGISILKLVKQSVKSPLTADLAKYKITVPYSGDIESIEECLNDFNNAKCVIFKRVTPKKTREKDIKSYITKPISASLKDEVLTIFMDIKIDENGSVKGSEALEILANSFHLPIKTTEAEISRTELSFKDKPLL